MKTEKRRLVIAEDHPLVRQGIEAMVAQTEGFEICAQVDTVPGALAAIKEHAPDVLVADITLRQGSGLDLIRRVSAQYPDMRILVLSMHDEFIYAARVFRAGAHGYVEKREKPAVFINALNRVAEGKHFVSPDMADQLMTRSLPGFGSSNHMVEALSDRELQVLEMLGSYASVREIADQLALSVKTIETYRDRLRNKLGIPNSKQLGKFAVQWITSRDQDG